MIFGNRTALSYSKLRALRNGLGVYRHISSSENANFEIFRQERVREFAEAQELGGRLMSLMGTAKRQMSSHGVKLTTLRTDKRDLPLSDADSPDLPAAKPLDFSNSRASSRAPKRVERLQDPKTPTTSAAKKLKCTITSKEKWRSTMRIDRVPLADLGSTQGRDPLTPKNARHREHHTPRIDGADVVVAENDQEPQKFGSDEESFGGGDIFTSTDQQQLSALRSEVPQHYYEETTTEF